MQINIRILFIQVMYAMFPAALSHVELSRHCLVDFITALSGELLTAKANRKKLVC
jgi:hypothetical protein